MKILSLVTALPEPSPTGWGNASLHINEELKKLAFVQDLNQVNSGLMLKQDFPVDFNVPVLQAAQGVNMLPVYPHLKGCSNGSVAYSFVEDNVLLRKYAGNVDRYWDTVVTGSTWAMEEMKDAVRLGDYRIRMAIQGVDTSVFRPHSLEKPDPEWFTIFSGGKWEMRKSQDVVIRAVKVLMERHADVRLVANWWNPWVHSAETMMESKLIQTCYKNGDMIDPVNCAIENGIIIDRIKGLGKITHEELCSQINKCDVALFPNRAEAGTNLVLMEAMACGLPVIATVEHGHADVTPNICQEFKLSSKTFTYKRQGVEVAEWFEPNLDQTVEALETAYNCRGTGFLEKEGTDNREFISQFTWEQTAKSLLEACEI